MSRAETGKMRSVQHPHCVRSSPGRCGRQCASAEIVANYVSPRACCRLSARASSEIICDPV